MKIIRHRTQKTYLRKSQFAMADKFALEGFLHRYPEHVYNIEVITKEKCYIVIATPKIEEV